MWIISFAYRIYQIVHCAHTAYRKITWTYYWRCDLSFSTGLLRPRYENFSEKSLVGVRSLYVYNELNVGVEWKLEFEGSICVLSEWKGAVIAVSSHCRELYYRQVWHMLSETLYSVTFLLVLSGTLSKSSSQSKRQKYSWHLSSYHALW